MLGWIIYLKSMPKASNQFSWKRVLWLRNLHMLSNTVCEEMKRICNTIVCGFDDWELLRCGHYSEICLPKWCSQSQSQSHTKLTYRVFETFDEVQSQAWALIGRQHSQKNCNCMYPSQTTLDMISWETKLVCVWLFADHLCQAVGMQPCTYSVWQTAHMIIEVYAWNNLCLK